MTTYTDQVAADQDDLYDYNGVPKDRTVLYSNYSDANALFAGWRFTGVTIGQGDLINAGTFIELRSRQPSTDDISMDIHAEAADDSAALEGGTQISARTLTTAFVNWVALNVGSGSFVQSPDIPLVIQEVIDRAGWNSGQDLTIITEDTQSSFSFVADDFSFVSSSAGKITIDYTPGGTPSLRSQRLKSGVGR